jgi:hypothetical protein
LNISCIYVKGITYIMPNKSDTINKVKLSHLILLRMYILRYIRHLKHITWMPGSIAVNKMIEEFDGKKIVI